MSTSDNTKVILSLIEIVHKYFDIQNTTLIEKTRYLPNQHDTTAIATPTVNTEANQHDTTATATPVSTEANQDDTTATATPTVNTILQLQLHRR
jgi:hypothetical protein